MAPFEPQTRRQRVAMLVVILVAAGLLALGAQIAVAAVLAVVGW